LIYRYKKLFLKNNNKNIILIYFKIKNILKNNLRIQQLQHLHAGLASSSTMPITALSIKKKKKKKEIFVLNDTHKALVLNYSINLLTIIYNYI
jgi:hypothetical protein